MSDDRLRRMRLDWRAKGLPAIDGALAAERVPEAGWNLFDGSFLLPTMVIREAALEHDITLMARWAHEAGVSLAPHGKTTMSPQIWQRQLDAGAWAITLATPWQARVAVMVGVPRILIANEVVDEAGMAWLGSQLDRDAPDLISQVDSVAGVERLEVALGSRRRRLPVLVEVGLQDGRTGVRSVDAARAVMAAVTAAPSLALSGVTCFEGIVRGDAPEERRELVSGLLSMVRDVAELVGRELERQGAQEMILSGGGSIHFLAVAEALSRPLTSGPPVRVVIRSGCTVTHDHVGYDLSSPFGSGASPGSPRLDPALEVWAPVLSMPQPGLAVVGAGRRDLPYDSALPAVLKVRHGDGSVRPMPGATVTGLNDQHAYLGLEPEARLRVGDSVALGIGHPCSAFDRWRFIPLVQASYDVVEVIETIF